MRSATFTSVAQDEVELKYIQDYGPEHKETGKRALVYYSSSDYARKQEQHGKETYPEPS